MISSLQYGFCGGFVKTSSSGGGYGMSNKKDPRLFIYRIDQEDNIVYVNQEWLEFAKENSPGSFKDEYVINKSLWKYIANDKVQHLYKIVFNRVRDGVRISRLPFRCDSPECRRFMEMDLFRAKGSEVQIESRILKQEFREPIALLSNFRDCSNEILTICSFCKKIRIDESTWTEVEEAMKRLRLYEVWPLPQISHGACETCFKEATSRLDDLEII